MSFKTLNIGATAMLTHRYALDTVGQNIANASTPGYSRQQLMFEPTRPDVHTFGALGGGVLVREVRRVADEFLEKQVRIATSSNAYYETVQDGYENLEVFFNELTENDLSSAMDTFWNSVSDFSNNVEDISTRRAVIESARTLRDTFQRTDRRIRDYRERMNEAIETTVGRVNSILKEVAELNTDIVKVESGGATNVSANDLRDQRTERLKELSELMDVTVTDQPNGAVLVTQKSRMLVFLDKYYELSTREENSDDIVINTPVFAEDEEEVILEDGKLKAQIDVRDELLLSFKEDVDGLAASFIWEVNRVHSQGVGLEGYSAITGRQTVINPETTLDKLDYEFTPLGESYRIENGNVEVIVHDKESDEETVLNIEVDLDGVGNDDTFMYDDTDPTSDRSFINKLQSAFDTVRPGAFTVNLDISGRLRIVSNLDQFTFGFGRDTSGVLAATGLNTFFDGYDAGSLAITDAIADNPDRMAGARSFAPGDNTGALALLELRETGVLNNDSATFDDYYEGIVGRLGVEGARTDSLLDTQKDILTRMENQREDLSGVNMDEELTKMIQYQRSFQGAARFISTADTLYETMINM